MSYIVHIEGSDPFIARSKPAIVRGLHDLLKGEVVSTYTNESKTCVRITYKDNIGEELTIVADKAEAYR